MERNFYKEDFEKFLKENANQYRMYPSERVWKGIYNSLHTGYKWYRISGLVLLLAILTGSIVLFTGKDEPASKKIPNTEITELAVQPASNNPAEIIAGEKTAVDKISLSAERKVNKQENIFIPSNEFQNRFSAANNDNSAFVALLDTEPATAEFEAEATDIPGGYLSKDVDGAERIYTQIKGLSQDISENTLDNISLDRSITDIQVRKNNKVQWQLHFTPTIGYRKLSENKAYLRSPAAQNSSFGYTAFLDVNNVVDHKPDMGLEAGLDAKIPLMNRLNAKTGLQINVTRYGIRAYSYRAEMATIALNSGYGLDSLNAISNFRNFNGYNPNWLENLYVQVAIPIGAEFILAENDKVKFGIASSFQPTYLLGKKAYLISGDYKNYVKVPHLVRRWNMNMDFETFVSYSTGKIRWQVGPQARYQLLSSFVNEYPVKENLFNFGLKVGMSLNNK